ncbi:DedA family protein [Bacillus sp. AK128]
MELETAFYFVQQYGYIALFLVLWIGFFCIPVPNEVIVMSSGFFISQGILDFSLGLTITFLGVIMSLTTLYVLGRFCFYPLQKRFLYKPKIQKHIDHAGQLIEKYGGFALMIGYCFPGVRHFVPFIIGSHRMKFYIFALYAYTTAAIWTSIFFTLGYYFGENIDYIIKNIFMYGAIFVAICALVILSLFLRKRKKYRIENIS